jgi:RNA polymerase sigma-70 factor (ECF subfamily)
LEIGELIEKVKQGDANSFEPIIRMYQQKIFSYCYYLLGHKQEAEDAVQEIFFKAFRCLDSYRYDHSFLAWLYKLAANHCRTMLTRRKRWRLLQLKFWAYEQAKSAEEIYAEQAGFELNSLAGLSVTEKEILILRVMEDHSFEEIARILGIRPAAVRKRFERLKRKLNGEKRTKEGLGYEQRVELR